MKKLWLIPLLVAATALAGPGENPVREILGLNLNMTNEEARERLEKIGSREKDEAGWQEVWKVRDDHLSHVIVGFGKDEKLHYVTAVAREDKEAKRVPYSDIGNLKKSLQAGDVKIKNFKYEWELPAGKENPRMQVIAAGRDPKFLTTYSLKNLDNLPAKEEKD